MRQARCILGVIGILGLGLLSGCASILPPSPLAPFFVPDSADAKLIDALAHEQYTRIEHCQAARQKQIRS